MIKKAFTLVEILITIAVIGIIISVTSVSYSRTVQNNKIDACESELRDFSNSISSYMIDYGNIILKADDNYEPVIDEIVNILNASYFANQVSIIEIAPDKKSVKLTTKVKTDPWGNKYHFSIYTHNDNIPGLVIINSNGIDGKTSSNTYKDNIFGDDIVSIIEPK